MKEPAPQPLPRDAGAALLAALGELHDALLGPDAAAIDAAARRAGAAVAALEHAAPPPALLEQLAALNHRAGALVAARQAAVAWALSRLGQVPALYDADGQRATVRVPRRLASA